MKRGKYEDGTKVGGGAMQLLVSLIVSAVVIAINIFCGGNTLFSIGAWAAGVATAIAIGNCFANRGKYEKGRGEE